MKNTLLTLKVTLIQFLIFFSFSAFSQCNIDFLFVEITACEGDLFDVSIDFEYENTSDQFTVVGNGNSYGTFNYTDLPITLTSLEADCVTDYEFVVSDTNDNNCTDFVEWGTVCCEEQCVLSDLILTTSECEDGDFFLTIDFDYQWNTSATFDWEIVGVSAGAALFTDLPLTVQVFDNINELLGFTVIETGNPDCFLETSFENPCSTPTCFIGVVFVEVTDCVDGEFGAVIDFQYSNTSDQFTVAGNGVNYGTYLYADLPITIDGLAGDCSTEYEFEVTDVNTNDCSNFNELGTICCGEDCFIGELDVEVSECDGNFFFVVINFEYENTSDQFTVNGNGNSYGTFSYADLPITIDGLESDCDLQYEFVVHDVNNNDCASDVGIGEVCCEGECEIFSIDFGPNPTCIDGFIVTEWFIFAENTSEVGYDIFINGAFLTFVDYNGTGPYYLDIEDTGTEFFTIQACDNDNPNCCYTWELMNPCYEYLNALGINFL